MSVNSDYPGRYACGWTGESIAANVSTQEIMNVLATTRHIRNRGARSALTVGLLAWLGFLLQPCAMAAPLAGIVDAGDGVELTVITHHGPGLPAEQCLHCVDDTSTGNLLPQSCDDSAASSHSSAAKSFEPDGDGWSPAVLVVISPDSLQYIARLQAGPRAENLPRPVSLTVAYCVFLE